MKTLFFETDKAGQTGFTLIEIMISLALGLILMGGVISVFISTKQAYLTKENSARMQENITFSTDLLRRMISSATAITAGNSNSFTITNSSSCIGSSGSPSYPNSFSINNSNLVCSDGTGTTSVAPPILIDNVKSLSITYGQDTDGDGQVNSYTNAFDASNTVSIRIVMTMILDPKTSSTTDDITQQVTINAAIRSKILSKVKLSS